MRRIVIGLSLACALLSVAAQEADGQKRSIETVVPAVADSSTIQVVRLSDGSSLIGRIVAVRDDSVDIETSATSLTVSRATIREITTSPASALRDGEYWFPNPNTSRLLFGPTAQMLKKGEGYIAAFELFFLGGAVGVTDHFTIGGGTIVPAPGTIYFITPKIGFSPAPRLHVATGAMIIGIDGESETIGVFYGAATAEAGDGSLTAGLGYGFAGSHVSNNPVVMLGGERRLSRRLGLVTENYLIPGLDPLLSFGFRFLGEKLSADIGIMRVSDSGDSTMLPLVNFVAKF